MSQCALNPELTTFFFFKAKKKPKGNLLGDVMLYTHMPSFSLLWCCSLHPAPAALSLVPHPI